MKKLVVWLATFASFYALGQEVIKPIAYVAEEENPELNNSVHTVARDLKDPGRMAERTNRALDRLIRVATWRLKKAGHEELATEISRDWKTKYSNFLTFNFVDLGDHNPLSEWLDTVYQALLDKLGEKILKRFHLDDIWVINYAIPVVFRPCRDEWDKPEYKLHFVPFAGSVTYWAVYIGCTIATASMDFSFFCSPAGTLAETFMSSMIAPRLSDTIYSRRCE